MPYKDISDLPKSQVDQYDTHQKRAFRAAYKHPNEEYGHDEGRPVAVAPPPPKEAG
jgi:cation transport regulator